LADRYSGVGKIGKNLRAVLAIALAVIAVSLAQAQTVDKACADAAGNSAKGDLSDKLDRTNGVICPPDVDARMKAPTPNAGNTPVIPPPGSPGGDQSVRPK
jgi:hypothetical protein